jgi:hypothetical protein
MKVSFDLDGTLFGVHSEKLVDIYNRGLEHGDTMGILTARGLNNPRGIIQAEVRRLGIAHWDFWYDAVLMTQDEIKDIIDLHGVLSPAERLGAHKFKKRMIESTNISLHFDDECEWLWKLSPQLPLIDVSKWGGDSKNLPSIGI